MRVHRSVVRAAFATIEQFEQRLMLSGGGEADVWVVTGDADTRHPNDVIVMGFAPGEGGAMLNATVNGSIVGRARWRD